MSISQDYAPSAIRIMEIRRLAAKILAWDRDWGELPLSQAKGFYDAIGISHRSSWVAMPEDLALWLASHFQNVSDVNTLETAKHITPDPNGNDICLHQHGHNAAGICFNCAVKIAPAINEVIRAYVIQHGHISPRSIIDLCDYAASLAAANTTKPMASGPSQEGVSGLPERPAGAPPRQ